MIFQAFEYEQGLNIHTITCMYIDMYVCMYQPLSIRNLQDYVCIYTCIHTLIIIHTYLKVTINDFTLPAKNCHLSFYVIIHTKTSARLYNCIIFNMKMILTIFVIVFVLFFYSWAETRGATAVFWLHCRYLLHLCSHTHKFLKLSHYYNYTCIP